MPEKKKTAPPANSSASSQTVVANASGKGPTPRYATKIVNESPFKPARPTPGTGTLSVETMPKATVLIELVGGKVASLVTLPSDARIVNFNTLSPGTYRVAVELEGYYGTEAQVFVVVNKQILIKLPLQPK